MKRRFSRWTSARRLVGLGFLVLFVLAIRGALDPWFQGSPLFTRSFGVVPLADPLVALESVLAGGHLSVDMLVGVGILLLLAAALGPVFCGWICPLGWLLDLNGALRDRVLAFFRRRRRRSQIPDSVARRSPPEERPVTPAGVRYGVLGLLLGFVLVAGVPVFLVLSPINLAARALATGAVVAVSVLVAIVVLEWFLPRFWCRVLCPLGALYSIVGRWAPWRVRTDPATAGKLLCQLCSRHCTMGIRIMEDHTTKGATAVDDPACTRCGTCLDSCPGSVLRMGFWNIEGGGVDSECEGAEAQSNSSASAQSRA